MLLWKSVSFFAFRPNGSVLVGHDAVAQADHNPLKTFYDAKRFIGKKFSDESEFKKEIARYPFEVNREKSIESIT